MQYYWLGITGKPPFGNSSDVGHRYFSGARKITRTLSMKNIYTTMAMVLVAMAASAQCPNPGELEVYIDVLTDDYGNETYWELTPQGDNCGTNTVFAGGNSAVGCGGGGAQGQDMNGYDNNTTISEGPWCLPENTCFSIHSIDDWGDGHASYNVFVEGVLVAAFSGFEGASQTYSFTAALPAQYDLAAIKFSSAQYAFENSAFPIIGKFGNLGSETITSFDMNYSVNGNSPITSSTSSISIPPGETYDFSHSMPWIPVASGAYSLEIWATNLNGNADQNSCNDVLGQDVVISAQIPNIIDEYLNVSNILDVVGDVNTDLLVPRDLDFHPDFSRMELWVVNKDTENSGSSTVTFNSVGEAGQIFEQKEDANNWHFMSLATGIAMGDNGNFATSPGVWDANHGGDPTFAFTGPSLWSADMSIYAEPTSGNGSHLDMLHENPRSQGIAHESLNRYWVVDGFTGDIVMNDFVDDHGPGNSYHGDAIIKRYSDVFITRDPNEHIVSHAELDKDNGMLYVVDHGGQRVLRLDINTGVPGGAPIYPGHEDIAEYSSVTGYDWDEIINIGLVEPAGIDVIEDRLIVSDHSNGDIIIYDLSVDPVVELGRINTGAAGIMGITVGPHGYIWYVNANTNQLVRVQPGTVGIEESEAINVAVHPNPGSGLFYLSGLNELDRNASIRVMDLQGKVLKTMNVGSVLNAGMDLTELANGVYNVSIENGRAVSNTRVIINK